MKPRGCLSINAAGGGDTNRGKAPRSVSPPTLIILVILLFPVAASAQKDLFMKEFNEVNNWFFIQPQASLVQKYTYYQDSALVHPIDSSVCTIIKNAGAIHYRIAGMESFSENGYTIKISHADRSLNVSRTAKTDTAQLRALFNSGFSGFKIFVKTVPVKEVSTWELSGGTEGVNSARLMMDMKEHKIKSLHIYMAANHPLISPFKKLGQETDQAVIIKVDYQYQANIKNQDLNTLSDFITINEGSIIPSAKYKEYKVKLLAENQ